MNAVSMDPGRRIPRCQGKVKELAERQMHDTPFLDLRQISCDYHEGVLVLRGRLPSYYLKQMAQELVIHLDGIDNIENRIQVISPSRI